MVKAGTGPKPVGESEADGPIPPGCLRTSLEVNGSWPASSTGCEAAPDVPARREHAAGRGDPQDRVPPLSPRLRLLP
jgi:hypothetical protein